MKLLYLFFLPNKSLDFLWGLPFKNLFIWFQSPLFHRIFLMFLIHRETEISRSKFDNLMEGDFIHDI